MSADGRFIVFSSSEALLQSDENGLRDIYLYDATSQQLTQVTHGNANSDYAVISADGSTVVITSSATDLDPLGRDNDSRRDVYSYDVASGQLELLTVAASGSQSADADAHAPVISADGSVIAFWSYATNLDPLGRTSGTSNVYAYNLNTHTLQLVSVSADGLDAGNSSSNGPVISGNGRVVAFTSYASNLHSLDSGNTRTDVYAYDLQDSTMTLVSVAADGLQSGDGYSSDPAINWDGSRQIIATVEIHIAYTRDRSTELAGCVVPYESHIGVSRYQIHTPRGHRKIVDVPAFKLSVISRSLPTVDRGMIGDSTSPAVRAPMS